MAQGKGLGRRVGALLGLGGLLAGLLAGCGGEGDAGVDGDSRDASSADDQPRMQALAVAAPAKGSWGAVRSLPLVPVSMANLPDGKLLMWSAEEKFSFGAATGRTYSLVYDPQANTVAERTVTETGHNMFCPGTTNLADGRLLVNGGISAGNTSIFNPATGTWSTAAAMNIPRGYQANTLLQDGSVLTLGGSWAGGVGNKHGEVWTAAAGWRRLSGVGVAPFLSPDPSRNFGGDSHFMLLPAGNGRVFHAGPGVNMHWISTEGNGSVTDAGPRGDDEFSLSGTAVMYDTGKILKVGGGPGYDAVNANANSYLIDISGASGSAVTVKKLAPMAYKRAFHNSVVLPNGQVLVVGGQTFAVGFSDNNSVLVPELFDPATETFRALAPIAVPRNYHSVAILLPDGRVASAGGGLCGAGCAANHADLQIFTPHYLLQPDGSPAVRPVITAAPASAGHGQAITVATDSPISSFAMVRLSSTTHTVNNDQRRLSLGFRATGANTYAVDLPSNPGWALPGDWMLFAMNADGTPSIARILRLRLDGAVQFSAVEPLSTPTGTATSLTPKVSVPAGATVTYAATGLPPGIAVDAATGRLQGTPTAAGTYRVSLLASANGTTTSTEFLWTVAVPGRQRYVKLEALSEVAGNAWASAAELNLLDRQGLAIARSGWRISTDSQETAGENGAAANAIDGNPATIWHTQWQAASPGYPHWLVVDLGSGQDVAGLKLLPRQDATTNGGIARFNVYLSADGVNWGTPVASGNLADHGDVKAEKTVYFQNLAQGKPAAQSSTNGAGVAARAVDGNVDGVWANGSVAHTNREANPWWEVDLGSPHALTALRLWNRSDCCADRLANFYVLASDTPMQGRTLAQLLADASVWRQQTTGAAGRQLLLATASSGARGRYVRVQLAGTNYLQLAEVQVHGVPSANRPPTLATPGAASAEQGVATSLRLSASDPDGDTLRFSAAGLPPGIGLDAANGLLSGTPSTAGRYEVTVGVDDGRGGSAATKFSWTVQAALPQLAPVSAAPVTAGSTVAYTASSATAGVYTYQWNFGDGSPASAWSELPTASHRYEAPGVYFVTLTARTEDGRSSAQSFWQAVQAGGATGLSGRSSGQMALEPRSGASTRLWVVNPDNDSVSVLDTATRARVAEVAVGSGPRSLALAPDGRIWVVNKGAATVSIVSPTSLGVVQTVALPRASQPYAVVVAANGQAYVSLEATGRVLRLASNGSVAADVAVGANPRHLALDATGTRLYVSRFISPPLPGEASATVQARVAGAPRGGELLVLDATTLALQRSIVLATSEKPDNTVQGRGVPNYLGAPVIAPDGRSAWVPAKQDNVQRGKLRDGQDLDFQNTVRAISARIDLTAQAEDLAGRIDHDNSGMASAAAFHPGGAYLFVALATSRHVAVVDAAGKRELFRIDVGRTPQALSVSADGQTLYVHHFMDRSVGVHDLGRLLRWGESVLPLLATVPTVATDKLPANVLQGKRLFYDARDIRLARDAYISCAACHDDGGHDGRTWDFTGFGEGLRNTISLRGRMGAQGRLHWSGNFDEVQDFEGQIRTLAQGIGLMADPQFSAGTRSQPLGDRKAGQSADLDALAAYVASLSTFDATPWRQADGTLTSAGVAGRSVFQRQCIACHGGADFSDSAAGSLRNIGTLKASSGQRLGQPLTGIDTPTLRDAWATGPYLHDGSAATLEDAVRAHSSTSTPSLNATDLANVVAFVRQIGREEAAVGAAAGLRGEYFGNLSLSGSPLLTRHEAVDFGWGTGAPAAGLPVDNFSVRWTGSLVVPTTGSYRFQTVSDDGVRLWVNGVQLVNNWSDHSATTNTSGSLTLTAGQRVAVRLEYYERGVDAVVRLRWRPPGASSYTAVPLSALVPP